MAIFRCSRAIIALAATILFLLQTATAEITGLVLIDAAADTDIGPLADGDTLTKASLPSQVSVRAEVDNAADTSMVEFTVNGDLIQTEKISPYAIEGDNGNGNYNNWNIPDGEVVLVIKQSLKSGGSDTFTATITVSDGPATSPAASAAASAAPSAAASAAPSAAASAEPSSAASPAPPSGSDITLEIINAATGADAGPLTNGAAFARANLPASLSVRADNVNVQAGKKNQVKFYVNDVLDQTEGIIPYAINGDSSGNYVPWTVPIGETNLRVEHVVDNAVFDTLTITFTVTEGSVDPSVDPSPAESAAASGVPSVDPTPTESAVASGEASVGPSPGGSVAPGGTSFSINYGSTSAVDDFVADDATTLSAGTQVSQGSGPGIYASHRWDDSFTATIPLEAGAYDVTLYFYENYTPACADGARVFNVKVGDKPELTGLDVFQKAGCTTEHTEVFTDVDVTDNLVITLQATAQNAYLAGVKAVPAGSPVSPGPTPTAGGSVEPSATPGAPVSPGPGGDTFSLNLGSATADGEFIGDDGTTYVVGETKTSGGGGDIYATHRWGSAFDLNIPLASGDYDVTLYFQETYSPNCVTGARVFDILVGDKPLAGLDVFSKAGCNEPHTETFSEVTVTDALVVKFTQQTQNPFVSGIKVVPAGTGPSPGPSSDGSGESPTPLPTVVQPSSGPVPSPINAGDDNAHAVPPVYTDPFIDSDKNGLQIVNMDGSNSHTHFIDTDTNEFGTLVEYKWTNKDTGDVICEGPEDIICQYEFALGSTMIELCVTDSAGFTNCAETTVSVVESVAPGVYCYYYDFDGATGTSVPLEMGLESAAGASPKPLFGASGTDISFPNINSFPDFGFKTNTWAQRCVFFFDAPETETYKFTVNHIGGVALFVGEEPVINVPASSAATTSEGSIEIPEGLQQMDLIYYKNSAAAQMELSYNATAVTFKYDKANVLPIISTISPTQSNPQGTLVKVTGLNIDDTTDVLFGAAAGTGPNFKVPTEVALSAPAVPADTDTLEVDVVLSNLAGTSNAVKFTYSGGDPDPVKFTQTSFKTTGGGNFQPDQVAAIAIGPDFKYYMATAKGKVIVATVDHENNYAVTDSCESATLSDPAWTNYKNGNPASRVILGIAFNPVDTGVKAYIATSSLFWGPNYQDYLNDDYAWANGNIETIVPGGGCVVRDEIVISGLPVSNHDHSVNALVFDNNGQLHFQVGGFTNQGIPGFKLGGLDNNAKWGNLDESPLSAASVVANVLSSSFDGKMTYSSTKPEDAAISSGDVKTYATGLRNSYGLTLHSNGKFYATDNGPNGGFGDRSTDCNAQANSKGHGDKIIQLNEGKYYGSASRPRNECQFVDDNGNTVNGAAPPANYELPLAKVQASTNGIMEYTANTFSGQLRGDLFAGKYAASGSGLVWRVVLNGDGSLNDGPDKFFNFAGGLSIVQGLRGEIITPQVKKKNVNVLSPDFPTPTSVNVIAVTPFRGAKGGGKKVLITGHNFGSSPTASFGGNACTAISDVTATSFTCTTPAGTGLVDVAVTAGGVTATAPDSFWYMNI